MNRTQRLILFSGIALVLLLVLVPPWCYALNGAATVYGLIFWPPHLQDSAGVLRIDTVRWVVPMLVVAGLTTFLYRLAATKYPLPRTPSSELPAELQDAFEDQRRGCWPS